MFQADCKEITTRPFGLFNTPPILLVEYLVVFLTFFSMLVNNALPGFSKDGWLNLQRVKF